jgi:hypothetical protein
MDEEIERLLVSVRADTAGFARDVATMRAELEGPFAAGAARAGAALENALVRAVRTGLNRATFLAGEIPSVPMIEIREA